MLGVQGTVQRDVSTQNQKIIVNSVVPKLEVFVLNT